MGFVFLDALESFNFCKFICSRKFFYRFSKKVIHRKTAFIFACLHTSLVSFCSVPLYTAFEKICGELFDLNFLFRNLKTEILVSMNVKDLKSSHPDGSKSFPDKIMSLGIVTFLTVIGSFFYNFSRKLSSQI